MTKDEISRMLETIASNSTHPIVAFAVRDWDYSGQIQVEATFQVSEPKSAAATNSGSK